MIKCIKKGNYLYFNKTTNNFFPSYNDEIFKIYIDDIDEFNIIEITSMKNKYYIKNININEINIEPVDYKEFVELYKNNINDELLSKIN